MNGRKEHERTEYASQSLCLSVQVCCLNVSAECFERYRSVAIGGENSYVVRVDALYDILDEDISTLRA